MPNEQMHIYLAHISGFNWSKMIAKLSSIRRTLGALYSGREKYYSSVFVQNDWPIMIVKRLTLFCFLSILKSLEITHTFTGYRAGAAPHVVHHC